MHRIVNQRELYTPVKTILKRYHFNKYFSQDGLHHPYKMRKPLNT
uniref:Uncharacterized protein n=1 Tax=Anguilla anguilla TaxID=7936 RepID=A0A0E9VCN8_ANGAN